MTNQESGIYRFSHILPRLRPNDANKFESAAASAASSLAVLRLRSTPFYLGGMHVAQLPCMSDSMYFLHGSLRLKLFECECRDTQSFFSPFKLWNVSACGIVPSLACHISPSTKHAVKSILHFAMPAVGGSSLCHGCYEATDDDTRDHVRQQGLFGRLPKFSGCNAIWRMLPLHKPGKQVVCR